jgi:ankyrin repeat protein
LRSFYEVFEFAVDDGQREIVRYLINNDATIKNDFIYAEAASVGDIDIIKILIEKFGLPDGIGIEMLTTAAFDGNFDIVAYLVNELGIDINDVNMDGATALDSAIHHSIDNSEKEFVKIQQYLISHGAKYAKEISY